MSQVINQLIKTQKEIDELIKQFNEVKINTNTALTTALESNIRAVSADNKAIEAMGIARIAEQSISSVTNPSVNIANEVKNLRDNLDTQINVLNTLSKNMETYGTLQQTNTATIFNNTKNIAMNINQTDINTSHINANISQIAINQNNIKSITSILQPLESRILDNTNTAWRTEPNVENNNRKISPNETGTTSDKVAAARCWFSNWPP